MSKLIDEPVQASELQDISIEPSQESKEEDPIVYTITGCTSFTKSEWDSRKLTIDGVFSASFDIIFMTIFLCGAFGFLFASTTAPTEVLQWGYIAIGLLLLIKPIFVYFVKLLAPRDNYNVGIDVIRNGVKTTYYVH